MTQAFPNLCFVGAPGPGPRNTPAIQVDLPADTAQRIINSLKQGEKATIQLGKKTLLNYGNEQILLASSNEPSRHELYTSPVPDTHDPGAAVTNQLAANVRYRLAVNYPERNLDAHIAALQKKQNAAKPSYNVEIVGSHELDRLRVMKQNRRNLGRITPVPRAKQAVLYPSNASSQAHTPTSAPAASRASSGRQVDNARRRLIIHMLAGSLEPLTKDEIRQLTMLTLDIIDSILTKVALPQAGGWVLKPKAYRELDPYCPGIKFWTAEDQKRAIERAIKAFDGQRIDRTDPVWQRLLPEKERGQGIILSKLQLNTIMTLDEPLSPVSKPSTKPTTTKPATTTPATTKPAAKPANKTAARLKAMTKKVPVAEKGPAKPKKGNDLAGGAAQKRPPKKRAADGKIQAKVEPILDGKDAVRAKSSKTTKRPIADHLDDPPPTKRIKSSATNEKESVGLAAKTPRTLKGKVADSDNANSSSTRKKQLQTGGAVASTNSTTSIKKAPQPAEEKDMPLKPKAPGATAMRTANKAAALKRVRPEGTNALNSTRSTTSQSHTPLSSSSASPSQHRQPGGGNRPHPGPPRSLDVSGSTSQAEAQRSNFDRAVELGKQFKREYPAYFKRHNYLISRGEITESEEEEDRNTRDHLENLKATIKLLAPNPDI